MASMRFRHVRALASRYIIPGSKVRNGSIATKIDHSGHFRSTPRNGHHQINTVGPAVLPPRQQYDAGKGRQDQKHAMADTFKNAIVVVGIDIGKALHVGLCEGDVDKQNQPTPVLELPCPSISATSRSEAREMGGLDRT
jgi:hypothetical protein